MEILIVMDAVAHIDASSDTSLGLMLSAHQRGHGVRHCLARDVAMDGTRVWATASRVFLAEEVGAPITLEGPEEVDLADVDAVLVRPDPPFDSHYLTLTLILEHARHDTFIVNDPRGLREANEKLYACRFPDLMAPFIVTADRHQLIDFATTHGAAVVKPIDGHGGRRVHLLRPGDPNVRVITDSLTAEGRRPVMAQRFLPEVYGGDKRILVLDGEPLGAILRRPTGGDFRANIGLGGTVEAVDLDDRDVAIVETIAPSLRADGLWFVGIDVIGGWLSEVNVTSPTGIRQLGALTGTRPDHQVLEWLETRTGHG